MGYKLIIGPALVLLLYVGGLGLHGSATRITLFEAAMGPQIGGSIVAIQYGLNAPLISLAVGVGTVLSFITLPLWWACSAIRRPRLRPGNGTSLLQRGCHCKTHQG